MKFIQKKPFLLVPIVIVIVLAFLFVFTSLEKTKTSVVTGTYNYSPMDGCDGFKLKNGDTVDTFCFWTKPENQTDYEGPIKVGDRVEYGTESGKQFIRLKR